MREREIERKLVSAVKSSGGICPKFVSPGFDGMPDRVVLLPHGKFGFVEVKRSGEKPRPLQIVVLCQDLVQIKMRSSAC